MKYVLWLLAISASQFYIFKSGVPQPAHLVIIALFFYYFYYSKQIVINIFSYNYVAPIGFFVLYAILINTIFGSINLDFSFVFSSVYFLFGLLTLVATFFSLVKDSNNVKPIMFSLYAGLLLLFIFSFLKVGRFDFFPRFNAFFNDPNQMAFWALCVSSSFFLLSSVYKTNVILVASSFVMLVFIILSSASRSALVGIIPVLLGLVILNKDYFTSISAKIVGIFFAFTFISYFIYSISGMEQTQYLMDRFVTTETDQQLSDRGYDRFSSYFEYLLFGAGQGADFRFNSTHEIHSTWAGVLFYYGFIGFSFFIYFLIKIFISLSLAEKLIFLSPLMYSFSTFGARTPIFWVFIAVAIFIAYQRGRSFDNS